MNIARTIILFASLTLVSAAGATPQITGISGLLAKDETLTITGSGFTQKANQQPLFWWKADEGQDPTPLGRKTSWDDAFWGSFSPVAAPGSTRSMAFDHGSMLPEGEPAAMGGIYFNSDRLYVYRKIYEDFDITKDFAIRTGVSNVSGTISPGDTLRGATSGATGVVQKVLGNEVYYNNVDGTINQNPPTDFIYGEKMTGPNATMTNSEGTTKYPNGIWRTFNYKTIRLWTKNNGPVHAAHVVAQMDSNYFYMTAEGTNETVWNLNGLSQQPNVWQSQELLYKASDIDVANGRFTLISNGHVSTNQGIKTRTSQFYNNFNLLVQSQVSHNAQPGSNIHFDSVYVDDTWHRVIICSSASWSQCKDREIQIPLSWNDREIKVSLNPGALDLRKPAYLYVVDANDNVNSTGYPICPTCPMPPDPF